MNTVILLVDDDSAFRESVNDILEIEDYQVIEAKSGKEALSIIENKNGQVDLVITDMLMPEIEGNQLAAKIKKLRPNLKIIGMTGGGRIGTPDAVVKMAVGPLFETILRKPFLAEDLIAQIVVALS